LEIRRSMLDPQWCTENGDWVSRFVLPRNNYRAGRIDRTWEIRWSMSHPLWSTENAHWVSGLVLCRNIYRAGGLIGPWRLAVPGGLF